MKKKNHTGTVLLVLLFLAGLMMFAWPVANELISYETDDSEYENLAENLHVPEATASQVPLAEKTSVPIPEPAATPEIAPTNPVEVPTTIPPEAHEIEATFEPAEPISTDMPDAVMPTEGPIFQPTVPATDMPPIIIWEDAETSAPAKPSQSTEQPASSSVDLDACLRQNRDFVAWIVIPGTKINYPVVRSNDTEHYLHHLFSGKESKLGCLFSLKSSDYETPSKNIAIYGHHLNNSDAMFSTLLKYKSASHYSGHSVIRLDTLYGKREYKIFAVLNMNVTDWDAATASFGSNDAFMRFVNRARQSALYETGVQVTAEDHILTLITCDRSYGGASGRLIVMAVQQD